MIDPVLRYADTPTENPSRTAIDGIEPMSKIGDPDQSFLSTAPALVNNSDKITEITKKEGLSPLEEQISNLTAKVDSIASAKSIPGNSIVNNYNEVLNNNTSSNLNQFSNIVSNFKTVSDSFGEVGGKIDALSSKIGQLDNSVINNLNSNTTNVTNRTNLPVVTQFAQDISRTARNIKIDPISSVENNLIQNSTSFSTKNDQIFNSSVEKLYDNKLTEKVGDNRSITNTERNIGKDYNKNIENNFIQSGLNTVTDLSQNTSNNTSSFEKEFIKLDTVNNQPSVIIKEVQKNPTFNNDAKEDKTSSSLTSLAETNLKTESKADSGSLIKNETNSELPTNNQLGTEQIVGVLYQILDTLQGPLITTDSSSKFND